MNDQITTIYADLQQASDLVGRNGAIVEQNAEQLLSIGQRLSAVWAGDGADGNTSAAAFAGLNVELNDILMDLRLALKQTSVALHENMIAAQRTEMANTANLGGIAVR